MVDELRKANAVYGLTNNKQVSFQQKAKPTNRKITDFLPSPTSDATQKRCQSPSDPYSRSCHQAAKPPPLGVSTTCLCTGPASEPLLHVGKIPRIQHDLRK